VTPLIFVLTYAAAVVAFVPGSPMTIVGGAMFGLVRGTAYSLAGAILGAASAFLIARSAARTFLARRLENLPRVAAVERAVSARGRSIVFLLRLSPVVPFNVLNYVLGLTSIPLRDFLTASAGMIPGTLMYAYGGAVAGQALALTGKAEPPHAASYYVLLTLGFGTTVAATMVIARTARRALGDV
jgi:uncharacterized membrane protein YdjX (TVP38/TMEM64 family)